MAQSFVRRAWVPGPLLIQPFTCSAFVDPHSAPWVLSTRPGLWPAGPELVGVVIARARPVELFISVELVVCVCMGTHSSSVAVKGIQGGKAGEGMAQRRERPLLRKITTLWDGSVLCDRPRGTHRVEEAVSLKPCPETLGRSVLQGAGRGAVGRGPGDVRGLGAPGAALRACELVLLMTSIAVQGFECSFHGDATLCSLELRRADIS